MYSLLDRPFTVTLSEGRANEWSVCKLDSLSKWHVSSSETMMRSNTLPLSLGTMSVVLLSLNPYELIQLQSELVKAMMTLPGDPTSLAMPRINVGASEYKECSVSAESNAMKGRCVMVSVGGNWIQSRSHKKSRVLVDRLYFRRVCDNCPNACSDVEDYAGSLYQEVRCSKV